MPPVCGCLRLQELQRFLLRLHAVACGLGLVECVLELLDQGVELTERQTQVVWPLRDVVEEGFRVLLRTFDLLLDGVLVDADAVLQLGFLFVVRHVYLLAVVWVAYGLLRTLLN